jgi:hypothetical protein
MTNENSKVKDQKQFLDILLDKALYTTHIKSETTEVEQLLKEVNLQKQQKHTK